MLYDYDLSRSGTFLKLEGFDQIEEKGQLSNWESLSRLLKKQFKSDGFSKQILQNCSFPIVYSITSIAKFIFLLIKSAFHAVSALLKLVNYTVFLLNPREGKKAFFSEFGRVAQAFIEIRVIPWRSLKTAERFIQAMGFKDQGKQKRVARFGQFVHGLQLAQSRVCRKKVLSDYKAKQQRVARFGQFVHGLQLAQSRVCRKKVLSDYKAKQQGAAARFENLSRDLQVIQNRGHREEIFERYQQEERYQDRKKMKKQREKEKERQEKHGELVPKHYKNNTFLTSLEL